LTNLSELFNIQFNKVNKEIIKSGKKENMTGKTFFNAVANGPTDILGLLLKLLQTTSTDYGIIGGLAVNAYVEPVVSLDLDIVVIASKVDAFCEAAAGGGLKSERFSPSVNLNASGSDLRIQIQTDPRYQEFISRAQTRTILGYEMKVATLKDVFQGKLWAYADDTRRKSKRQKDLADLARLVETYPELAEGLPEEVRKRME